MSDPFQSESQCASDESGLTRRDFLRLTSGVIVLFSLTGDVLGQIARDGPSSDLDDPNAWLAVGPDSRVTVFVPAPDVGQGTRTSLAQMAAEELALPISSVSMVMGDTDRVPVPAPAGSTLATVGLLVRAAAAEAREILAQMAADNWGVPRQLVQIRDGRAWRLGDTETAISVGDLTRGRRLIRRLQTPPSLKPRSAYQLVGKPVSRVDGLSLVTGRARFVADMRLPNMAYAKILRPPCLGARLVRADTRAASAQPGVIAVIEQGDFVAVVAAHPEIAKKALRRIQAAWEEPDHPAMAALYEDLRASAGLTEQVREQGDVESAHASARHGFTASYRTPFVAHAPIEPHGAVAAQDGEKIVVYTGTQCPFAHREAVARALGWPPERVRVITTAVGGAFGGKNEADLSIEAARLTRALGRPVMVTHTRAEELTWNYFRPAALIDLQCGVSEAGEVVAWTCDSFNCGSVGAIPPYTFANQRIGFHQCRSPLRQGEWRGLGGPANTFAREAHLDHIASELGQDPIEFRLRHLAPGSRMARVVSAVAERYRWQTRRTPTGLGVGFACAADSGTYVAQIAEVEVAPLTGAVRVRRLLVAQDSGLIVNPDGIRNQIEGCVIMGLGFTLWEAVRYEQGRILTNTFTSYPIPAFPDTPAIDIVLVPNPDHPPQAAGTPAIFPIAAAVANAVFDATGKRIRELPLSPEGVRRALQTHS